MVTFCPKRFLRTRVPLSPRTTSSSSACPWMHLYGAPLPWFPRRLVQEIQEKRMARFSSPFSATECPPPAPILQIGSLRPPMFCSPHCPHTHRIWLDVLDWDDWMWLYYPMESSLAEDEQWSHEVLFSEKNVGLGPGLWSSPWDTHDEKPMTKYQQAHREYVLQAKEWKREIWPLAQRAGYRSFSLLSFLHHLSQRQFL